MITASRLAGFFAAHAIWCVSDGETLIPIYAHTTDQGDRRMDRLVCDRLEESVSIGKTKLANNEVDANDAVLLYDARIPVGSEKLDAIIIEMRAYFSPTSLATIAIPYTPKESGKFLVHKPKLLQWHKCEDFDLNAAMQAFFVGVADHEKGSKIWNESLDESK